MCVTLEVVARNSCDKISEQRNSLYELIYSYLLHEENVKDSPDR